jgi:hypothetical protein
MFTPETRTYIYGITTAAMPLLISFGALSEGIAQQVALLIAAILGVSAPALAKANVPKAEAQIEVIQTEGAIVQK